MSNRKERREQKRKDQKAANKKIKVINDTLDKLAPKKMVNVIPQVKFEKFLLDIGFDRENAPDSQIKEMEKCFIAGMASCFFMSAEIAEMKDNEGAALLDFFKFSLDKYFKELEEEHRKEIAKDPNIN